MLPQNRQHKPHASSPHNFTKCLGIGTQLISEKKKKARKKRPNQGLGDIDFVTRKISPGGAKK